MIHTPVSSRSRFLLVLTVILGLTGGLLAVAQAWLLSRVIARVFLDHQGLANVLALLEYLGVIILGRAAIAMGSEICATFAGAASRQRLRSALHQAVFTIRPGYTSERSGDLVAVVVEGVEAVEAYFSQYLPQLALAALIPIAILAVVFPRDWLSGIILLLTAPLLPLFLYLIGTLSNSLTRKQFIQLSRLSAHFLDTLQGLKVLKEMGRSREYGGVITRVSEQYRDATLAVLRVSFLSALALEAVGTLSTALLAVEISLRLLKGGMGFETALFILVAAPEFYLPLRTLGLRFHTGSAGLAAARRIAEVLGERDKAVPFVDNPIIEVGKNAKAGELGEPCLTPSPSRREGEKTSLPFLPGRREGKESLRRKTPAGTFRQDLPIYPSLEPPLLITFSSVCFTYPGSNAPAVEDLSFCLPPGETTILAGESGAGKSTIAGLLLGILKPEAGRITINGFPLAEIQPSVWHSLVAWVPQDPYLFYGTLSSNLAFSEPDAPLEKIQQAAQDAGLLPLIQTLPQGYNTLIGERGLRLSSGEAQRVALGRAFLKGAPFILMDEPTTYLDPELDESLQAALSRLCSGKTTLIIAHKARTLRRAARLLVLESGRLVQEGSPRFLAAEPGPFRRLLGASGGEL